MMNIGMGVVSFSSMMLSMTAAMVSAFVGPSTLPLLLQLSIRAVAHRATISNFFMSLFFCS